MFDNLFQYLIEDTLLKSILAWLRYGYVPMVLLLLGLYINKQRRGLALQLLELVNWISLACTILIIVSLILPAIEFFLQSTNEERFVVSNRWTGPYAYGYWWLLLAQYAPILFFIRKCRTTFWLPVAIIVLGYPADTIILVTNMFDDFDEHKISLSYHAIFVLKYLIGFVLYSIILGIVYWYKNKRDARVSQ